MDYRFYQSVADRLPFLLCTFSGGAAKRFPAMKDFKGKLKTLGLFALINALIAIVIATRYFQYLPVIPTDSLGFTFLVTSVLSQMSLLAGILALIGIPFLILPSRWVRWVLALIATLALSLLVIDTFVFAQYRFHINSVVLQLIMSGQVVSFAVVTWVKVVGCAVAVLAIERWMVSFAENRMQRPRFRYGKAFCWFIFVCLLTSNAIHTWGSANGRQSVLMTDRYLPLFYPLTANSLMKKMGWINPEVVAEAKSLKEKKRSDLNYPLSPLQTERVNKPLNILFLVIDSWRYDSFTQDVSPNLWKYAQQGRIYDNHISTGNATRAGIFGLFYGIPSTYWQAFLASQRSPVLIDRLQQLGYDVEAFTSAKLDGIPFDRTIFRHIPHLRLDSDGNSPSERDQDVNHDWMQWFEHHDKSKPSFSFIFYDSPHGYDFPDNYRHKFQPYLKDVDYLKLNNDFDVTPFMNRYKTAVHFTDSLAGKVLDKLKASGELDNTVVFITGDHGQELNDNKLNYWGHNSNFTPYQTHVPFVVLAPGLKHSVETKVTSHEDVAPTLLHHYLGVTNPIAYYSTGIDMLDPIQARPWVLSAKYTGYAVITDKTILEVNSATGMYELLDKTNRPIEDKQPNFQYLKGALEQISRFIK